MLAARLRKLTTYSFFINDAHQIRMIGAPEKPFEFFATTDDRHNQVRDEAMHGRLLTVRNG
jgi:hypothetical protein